MIYNEVVDRQVEWRVPFKRSGAFPLDRSSIFNSLDELNEYLAGRSNKGEPYIGQIVAVSFTNTEKEDVLDVYKVTGVGESASIAPIIDLGSSLEYDDNKKLDVKIVNNEGVYNALTKDNNGALTVPMVDVKATKITNDIIIKDGPLAQFAEKVYPDGIVPKNTSLEDFLKTLLCKEDYPAVSANTSSYSLKLSDLSFTHDSNSIAEIGSLVTFTSVNANRVTIVKTNPKVETFTYGYSDTLNGDKNENETISDSWTVQQSAGTFYELSAEKSNFGGDVPSSVTATTYSDCILPECILTVNLGSNTYSVTEKAPDHVGSHNAIESKYIISNLGNTSEDKTSPSIDGKTNILATCNNKTNSITITGVYPVFTNHVDASTNNISEATRSNIKDDKVFEISYGPESIVECMDMFAYPASHTLVKVEKWSPLSNGGEYQEEAIKEIQISETTKKLGTQDVTYKIWKRLGQPYNDPVKIRFTLDKKTSVK